MASALLLAAIFAAASCGAASASFVGHTPQTKDGNRLRVLCLGDSITEGQVGVLQERHPYCYQLLELARRANVRNFEVRVSSGCKAPPGEGLPRGTALRAQQRSKRAAEAGPQEAPHSSVLCAQAHSRGLGGLHTDLALAGGRRRRLRRGRRSLHGREGHDDPGGG